MSNATTVAAQPARINQVALHAVGETLTAPELRQRACSELLRQAAMAEGLLGADDTPFDDGVLSEQASNAIEQLLERKLAIPEPSEEECRRHHSAHQTTYSSGERVRARHILFAVTPGVDVQALRQRAEATLLEVRCHDGSGAGQAFDHAARTLSNCPSGATGGDLGWLSAADCAPEFAKEIFHQSEVGVLPRLLHSRFGLHVVEVLERQAGLAQPFEAVQGAVLMTLRQKSYTTALRHYLSRLSADAELVGVDLEATDTPPSQ